MLPSMGSQRVRLDLGNSTPPPKHLLFKQSGAWASRPRAPDGAGRGQKGGVQGPMSVWVGDGGRRYNRRPTNPGGKSHLRPEFVILPFVP